MTESPSFTDFLRELKAGDGEAARRVFERYSTRLIALARTRMSSAMRQGIDPDDIVQSVFKSFFRHQAAGEYDFENWKSLWGLLALITIRKCCRQARRQRTIKRDPGQKRAQGDSDGVAYGAWDLVSNEPTPHQSVVLAESLESVLRQLEPRERVVVSLSLQGLESAEVAAEIRGSERTVRRALQRARELLERECGLLPARS